MECTMKPIAAPLGNKPLKDFTIEDLVTALASDAMSPGAGSAGGTALALAAACAGKAVAITRKHQSSRALEKLQKQLEHIRESALTLADRDAVQFKCLLQSDTPAAANALLMTDHTMLDTCRVLDTLLQEHSHLIADNVAGDWKAARALSDACLFIQLANVRELGGEKN
jgi:formiminotetrahydrofolate cyclodeaminase